MHACSFGLRGGWLAGHRGLLPLCWKQVALRGYVVARMEVDKRVSTALCQTDAIMGTRGLTFGFEITNVDIDSAVVCSRLPSIAIARHTSEPTRTNRWDSIAQLSLPSCELCVCNSRQLAQLSLGDLGWSLSRLGLGLHLTTRPGLRRCPSLLRTLRRRLLQCNAGDVSRSAVERAWNGRTRLTVLLGASSVVSSTIRVSLALCHCSSPSSYSMNSS